MKVLLIDPFTKTVSEAEHDGTLASIYKLTHCGTFTCCHALPVDDALYLDDEGLLGDLEQQAFFMIDGYPEPLAGYAIAVGCDADGESISPTITLADLRNMVRWITLDEIGGTK